MPEFVARAVCAWISGVGVKTSFIKPGKPWKNGFVERFNGKLRDEPLHMQVFRMVAEANGLIEQWRCHYSMRRLHSAPGYRLPALEVFLPMLPWHPSWPGPTGSSQSA